jgi:hypothetical protein
MSVETLSSLNFSEECSPLPFGVCGEQKYDATFCSGDSRDVIRSGYRLSGPGGMCSSRVRMNGS